MCAQEQSGATGEEDAKANEPFINVGEMELNIATKSHRAASMDVRRGREQARVASRQGGNANLPQIQGSSTVLPGLAQA